eukprot:scaffold663642_cov93-Prasinocladus_malaysianus.AAC.1
MDSGHEAYGLFDSTQAAVLNCMRLGSLLLRPAKGGCKPGTNWAATSVKWTSGGESSQSLKWM